MTYRIAIALEEDYRVHNTKPMRELDADTNMTDAAGPRYDADHEYWYIQQTMFPH